jgi:hypothetical protein
MTRRRRRPPRPAAVRWRGPCGRPARCVALAPQQVGPEQRHDDQQDDGLQHAEELADLQQHPDLDDRDDHQRGDQQSGHGYLLDRSGSARTTRRAAAPTT